MEKSKTLKDKTALRTGFSTGACATAVCTAAWLNLENHTSHPAISLIFPDGKERELKLRCTGAGTSAIIKDGGDDPDITNGIEIIAKAEYCAREDQQEEDYLFEIGKGVVILRVSEGIGKCTRSGLDCVQGKWAINIGPRKMIKANLKKAGFGEKRECILLSLTAVNGELIGSKTLNPTLGVLGGISILGTSGLVHPYSNQAYIDTIRVQVRSAIAAGSRKIVFATGGRTKRSAQTLLPGVSEEAFICIADFIAESLREVSKTTAKESIIACMPGKLCKYAAGYEYTHAHKNSQNMGILIEALKLVCPDSQQLQKKLEGLPSVRGALEFIPDPLKNQVLNALAERALKHMRKWNPNSYLRIMLFGFDGEHIFTTGDVI